MMRRPSSTTPSRHSPHVRLRLTLALRSSSSSSSSRTHRRAVPVSRSSSCRRSASSLSCSLGAEPKITDPISQYPRLTARYQKLTICILDENEVSVPVVPVGMLEGLEVSSNALGQTLAADRLTIEGNGIGCAPPGERVVAVVVRGRLGLKVPASVSGRQGFWQLDDSYALLRWNNQLESTSVGRDMSSVTWLWRIQE